MISGFFPIVFSITSCITFANETLPEAGWAYSWARSTVNTFNNLHSRVLALCWAERRMIGPLIVCEGPGAGWGQGAGPLSSLLQRDRVRTGTGDWPRLGARGRAGCRDGLHRGAARGGLFICGTRRGSFLPIPAFLSHLLFYITVCVHRHRDISLQNSIHATVGLGIIFLFPCDVKSRKSKTHLICIHLNRLEHEWLWEKNSHLSI